MAQWEYFLPGASRYSLGAISYSWSQDLWAQGGWAYPTKSQEKRLFNELSKPEGRIFFAGEHTASARGWIQPTFRRFMEDNSISGKENRVKLKLADESQ
ncbi:MAG: hypothetical protein GC158_03430 [Cyanobacteria bacterium RI_101]|nr:hypothetical protein [Cyanobacteria bacterium RI_101]